MNLVNPGQCSQDPKQAAKRPSRLPLATKTSKEKSKMSNSFGEEVANRRRTTSFAIPIFAKSSIIEHRRRSLPNSQKKSEVYINKQTAPYPRKNNETTSYPRKNNETSSMLPQSVSRRKFVDDARKSSFASSVSMSHESPACTPLRNPNHVNCCNLKICEEPFVSAKAFVTRSEVCQRKFVRVENKQNMAHEALMQKLKRGAFFEGDVRTPIIDDVSMSSPEHSPKQDSITRPKHSPKEGSITSANLALPMLKPNHIHKNNKDSCKLSRNLTLPLKSVYQYPCSPKSIHTLASVDGTPTTLLTPKKQKIAFPGFSKRSSLYSPKKDYVQQLYGTNPVHSATSKSRSCDNTPYQSTENTPVQSPYSPKTPNRRSRIFFGGFSSPKRSPSKGKSVLSDFSPKKTSPRKSKYFFDPGRFPSISLE